MSTESSPLGAEKQAEAIARAYARKALDPMLGQSSTREDFITHLILEAAAAINATAAIQRGDGQTKKGRVYTDEEFANLDSETQRKLIKAGWIVTPPSAKPNETSGATPETSPADERLKHFTQQELDDAAGELGDSDEGRRQFPSGGVDAREWRARAESYHDRWNKAEHELAKAKEDLAASEGARKGVVKAMLKLSDELNAVRAAGAEAESGTVEQVIEEILKPEEPTRRQYLEEHDYQKAVRRHAYRIDKATGLILSKLAAAKSTPGVES